MSDTPQRIQRKRSKGWRMPPNTVYVGRGTRWGNPFVVGETISLTLFPSVVRMPPMCGRVYVRDREHAVYYFQLGVTGDNGKAQFHQPAVPSVRSIQTELAGKHLACWCPLTDANGHPVPCHADVLLEIANQGEDK